MVNMNLNKNLALRITNFVAFALNCALTYLSLTGIFGDTNTALSLKFQTLVTPIGWAFSIWGAIFIWEGVFALFQFLPRFRHVIPAIHLWWTFVCASQIGWSIAFAQEIQWLALTFMLMILAGLAIICVRVSTGEAAKASTLEFWLLKGPFFLQLGWICAASVVNFNVVIDAMVPSVNGTGTLLANGTIVDGDGVLSAAYFTQDRASLLLGAAVVSLAVLFLVGAVIGTYPKRVNGNVIVCGVVAWALGGVAAQLRAPVYKTTHLFGATIVNAIGGAAAFLSIAMVLLVVALIGKLIFDECIRPRCGGDSAASDPLKHSLSLPNQAHTGGPEMA
eukprot:g4329.t1